MNKSTATGCFSINVIMLLALFLIFNVNPRVIFESSPLVGDVDQESQHHGCQHRHIDQDVVASLTALRAKVRSFGPMHHSILLLALLFRRDESARKLGTIPRKDVQVSICTKKLFPTQEFITSKISTPLSGLVSWQINLFFVYRFFTNVTTCWFSFYPEKK